MFSRGSSNELRAFVFQCQIYFHACKEEFLKDTERIFFAIFYLQSVALDYFEPFINEAEAYQNFDFLKDWLAFVQKLFNLFGLYSPEDDNKDAIVAISFPNNSKAVNYFIQFAKFQNQIHWDDRALRKVVKDTISDCILDELRFSHENVSIFEGLKRAVMRIDNDFWKHQQKERHKFQVVRAIQGYIPKVPRPIQGRPSLTSESSALTNKLPRDYTQGSLSQALSSSHPEQPLFSTSSILGPDGRLTSIEHQCYMSLGLCIYYSQSGHCKGTPPSQPLNGMTTLRSYPSLFISDT